MKNSRSLEKDSPKAGRPCVRATADEEAKDSSRTRPAAISGLKTSVTVLRLQPSLRAGSALDIGCAARKSLSNIRAAFAELARPIVSLIAFDGRIGMINFDSL